MPAEERGYQLHKVVEKQSSSLLLEESYLVMNTQEFNRYMGRQHKARDPKLQKMVVKTSAGEEELYLFKDPSSPFRRLKILSEAGFERLGNRLRKSEHVYATQPQEVFAKETSNLLGEQRRAQTLMTPEEYKSKVDGPPKLAAASSFAKRQKDPPSSCKQPASLEVDLADAMSQGLSSQSEAEDESTAAGAEEDPQNMLSQFISAPDHNSKTLLESSAASGVIASSVAPPSSKRPRTEFKSEVPQSSGSLGNALSPHPRLEPLLQASAPLQPGLAADSASSRWISKLPLFAVLEGQKMGVSAYHAEQAIKKMNATDQMAVKHHMKLVGCCKSLCQLEEVHMSWQEIEESVQQLLPHFQATGWPHKFMKVMHKLFLEWQCSKVNGESATVEDCEALWKCVQPARLAGSSEVFDILCPRLCFLEGQALEKVDLFMETWMVKVLLPRLQRSQKDWIIWLIPLLNCFMDQDLTIEMDDNVVNAYQQLKTVLSSLEGLLGADVKTKLLYRGEVAILQQASHDKSCLGTHGQTLSLAVKATASWSTLLADHCQLSRKYNIHEKSLAKVTNFLAHFKNAEFKVGEHGTELIETMRLLAILQGELPEACSELELHLQGFCQQVWVEFMAKGLSSTGGQLELKAMAGVLEEATISMPGWRDPFAWKRSLMEMGTSEAGKQKLSAMVAAWLKTSSAECEKEAHYSTLLNLVRDAHGIKMQEPGQAEVVEQMWESYAGQVVDPEVPQTVKGLILDILSGILEWVTEEDTEAKAEQVNMLRAMHKLSMSMDLLLKLEVPEMVEKEPQLTSLQTLLRDCQACRSLASEAWPGPAMGQALEDAEQLATTLTQNIKELSMAKVEKAVAATATQFPQGLAWDQGLPETASLEEVEAKLKTHILPINGQDMDKGLKLLKEALEEHTLKMGYLQQSIEGIKAIEEKHNKMMVAQWSMLLIKGLESAKDDKIKRRKLSLAFQKATKGGPVHKALTTLCVDCQRLK